MLELKHISYRVSTPDGEQDILKDISITIPDEKLVVFTGPNGGGKTTMAKVIMGLAEPTSRQILYNGQDITHLSITERPDWASATASSDPRFKGITVHDLLLRRRGKSLTRTSAAST
ncbi:MAG: ATP-binding cassette domain-containing protein [Oscillospiraceae bacterium]